MPDAKASAAAGIADVSDYGEKDVTGAYPAGTTFDIGGEKVDVNAIPDVIGGKAKAPAKRPKPAAPERRQ